MHRVFRSASYAVLAVATAISLFFGYACAASTEKTSNDKLYYEDVSKFYIYVRPPLASTRGYPFHAPPAFQRDKLQDILKNAVANRMEELVGKRGGERKPIEVLKDLNAIEPNAFIIYLVVGAQDNKALNDLISGESDALIKSYHTDMSTYDVAHYINTLNVAVGYFSKGHTTFNANQVTTAGTFERDTNLFDLLSQSEPISIFLGQPEEELREQLEDYLKHRVWLPSPKLKPKE